MSLAEVSITEKAVSLFLSWFSRQLIELVTQEQLEHDLMRLDAIKTIPYNRASCQPTLRLI